MQPGIPQADWCPSGIFSLLLKHAYVQASSLYGRYPDGRRACSDSENITVTNCRISSASSALKFCDGNRNAIRRVTVDNCVITSFNRGIAFMNLDHGYVSDVVLSSLTIETKLHDCFWWGDGEALHFNIKRRSEIHASVSKFPVQPIGSIRSVLIRNIIARGNGSSVILGHPESYLENVSVGNIRLFLSADPEHPMQKTSMP